MKAATHGELGKKQPLDPDGNPYPNPALETFQKESVMAKLDFHS